jgi:hypothetical protein
MPTLQEIIEKRKEEKKLSKPLPPIEKDILKEPFKEEITLSVKNTEEEKKGEISSFVGIEELTKTSINVPIRVMMSIVTQLKMFDINSNGLTPKGRNKKELKTEIKHLVSKLSEK